MTTLREELLAIAEECNKSLDVLRSHMLHTVGSLHFQRIVEAMAHLRALAERSEKEQAFLEAAKELCAAWVNADESAGKLADPFDAALLTAYYALLAERKGRE